MPFGRRPISSHSLEYLYSRGPSVAADVGGYNVGVFIVKRRSNGVKAVEKRIGAKEALNGDAAYEASIIRGLNHFNVIEYYDAFVDDRNRRDPRASIYMEYCDAGTLNGLLERRHKIKERLQETFVWKLFEQLVDAIAYLQYGIYEACNDPSQAREPHWVGVAHRDIKPSNIFLRSNPKNGFPDVVLGDFGRAIRADEPERTKRQVLGGDQRWAPPESKWSTFSGDVWAIGAIVQAACLLEPESQDAKYTRRTLYETHDRYGTRAFVGLPDCYSHSLDDACHGLMRYYPEDRPHIYHFAKTFRNREQKASRDSLHTRGQCMLPITSPLRLPARTMSVQLPFGRSPFPRVATNNPIPTKAKAKRTRTFSIGANFKLPLLKRAWEVY